MGEIELFTRLKFNIQHATTSVATRINSGFALLKAVCYISLKGGSHL